MADLQIGSPHGITAVGNRVKLAEITADGVNTVTVAATDLSKFHAGMVIDIAEADGTILADSRTIESITDAGVITYSGADEAAVAGTHAIYVEDSFAASPPIASNINGGVTAQRGFEDDNMDSIADMRARLTAIDATAYSSANLDHMTYNDMVYALRVHDHPLSLK